MAVTLNALKKAPVLDENGNKMSAGYTVTSSDPSVVRVSQAYGNYEFYAVGVVAGTATLTATRALDGAVATLDIEVIAASPFAISLGAEVAA